MANANTSKKTLFACCTKDVTSQQSCYEQRAADGPSVRGMKLWRDDWLEQFLGKEGAYLYWRLKPGYQLHQTDNYTFH